MLKYENVLSTLE